jgi:hypothetical protein
VAQRQWRPAGAGAMRSRLATGEWERKEEMGWAGSGGTEKKKGWAEARKKRGHARSGESDGPLRSEE